MLRIFLFLVILLSSCGKETPIMMDPVVVLPKLKASKYACSINKYFWTNANGIVWDTMYQGEMEVILHANFDTLTFVDSTHQLNKTMWKRLDYSNADYYFYLAPGGGNSLDLPTAEIHLPSDSCVFSWRQGGLGSYGRTTFTFKY